jgi:hypothetical protein
VVVWALLAGVIAADHVGKLPPALPSIRADLGLDIIAAGWLASSALWVMVVVNLLMIALALLVHRRKQITVTPTAAARP